MSALKSWEGYSLGQAVQIREGNEWPAGSVVDVWSNGVRVHLDDTSFGIAVSDPARIRSQGEPGTVIAATLKTRDLILAFEAELARLYPAGSMAAMFCAPTNKARTDSADAYWEGESADNYLELLTSVLDCLAPAGHYFGAHPGDGADFGFWEGE